MNTIVKKTSKTDNSTLSFKHKILIGGLASVFVLGSGVTFYTLFVQDTPETQEEQKMPKTATDEATTEGNSGERISADPYQDERPELDEAKLDSLTDQVYDAMYEGQWDDVIRLIEPADLDYNLEETVEGQHLRNLFTDAHVLVRLTAMGDNTDAVDAAVESLPRLLTEEMFVLGLYYLPRNVLLELSVDQLALAPTQRGQVRFIERIDMPFTNEDGSGNDWTQTDDVIANYLNMLRDTDFESGFVRFNINNGGIEETAYVVHRGDGNLGLVGFYSEDDNPANTTRTVAHHLKFREDVQAGIEALMRDNQTEKEGNEPTKTQQNDSKQNNTDENNEEQKASISDDADNGTLDSD